jgi:hypothetical protein
MAGSWGSAGNIPITACIARVWTFASLPSFPGSGLAAGTPIPKEQSRRRRRKRSPNGCIGKSRRVLERYPSKPVEILSADVEDDPSPFPAKNGSKHLVEIGQVWEIGHYDHE